MIRVSPPRSAPGADPAMHPGVVIALDIGGTKIDVALADRSGTVLERIRLETRAALGPEQALARAAEAAAQLTRRARAEYGSQVVGHAAVSPGVVLPDRVLLAPNLPGWEELPLAARLVELLGAERVPVANDVRAAALAELRFGRLRGVDPGIYLSVGTGIAAALTVGGTVLAGANQAAGEIGYTAFDPGAAGQDRAPLEELAGGKAVGERAGLLLGTASTAAEAYASTDPVAQQVVHQALGALSVALANLTVFVDPQRVVVGGGLMGSADTVLPVLAAHLRRAVPFPPEVVAAHFTQDASLHGAVALALDTVAAH
ncbi:ROK family protein [Kitasatospora sp. NPDC002040]|uniref:ROK family protein n=1 Tax=Kitasatospora sp. NPDC002040 TaxID=3154661 RepID=UPI00331E606B